jgi:acyl-CoA-binding protein
VLVFNAKLTHSVTRTAGRDEYQVLLTDQSGRAVASYMGSFNVSRGVMVDMPEDAADLSEYSLEQIYTMLSNVTTVYNQLANVENLIGMPDEVLETAKKTLIGAINDLQKKANEMQFEEHQRQIAEAKREAAEEERVKLYHIFKDSIYGINRTTQINVDSNGDGSVRFIGLQMKSDEDGNVTFYFEDESISGRLVFKSDGSGNVTMEVV